MTEKVIDYSDFDRTPEEKIGDNALVRLQGLAQEQVDCEALIASLEKQLEEAREAYNDVRLHRLPELMDELEIDHYRMKNGVELKMDVEIRSSIPKDKKGEAHQWLEDNNNGGLIKREIKISFGRDDEAWARKFMADCRKRVRPLPLTMTKAVNFQTLQKFVRDKLEAGDDLPQDLFGVYRQRFCKVKIPTK